MIIDFKRLTWVPCIIILVVTIRMCMALAELEMPMLSYGLLAVELCSFVFISFLYFKEWGIARYLLLVILYQMLILSFSILNGANAKDCFYLGCGCILMVTMMEYYKERMNMILFAYAIAFSFCVYLNFFHLITHPQLWLIEESKEVTGYLLGNNYNQMGCRLLCALAINMVCFRLKRFWIINTIPLIIVSVATVAIVKSMTSLTLIILFLVFCLIPSRKLQRMGIISLFVFYVLFQVFVCFNGKGLENNELAVYFIEDVLKKDITFTNRTELWDAAAHAFAQSPIIGYGYVDSDWYYSHMSSAAMGPHNFIYSVLINGGIVLLFVFIAIFITATKKAFTMTDRTTNVLLAATAVLLFMMTMEVYPFSFILLLLSFVYYRPYIKDKPRKDLKPSTIQVR